MKRTILGAVLAACLLAGPALAQPAPPAPSAEPSARSLELSHRLIVAAHVADVMAGAVKAMIPQMVDLQARQIPGFRPEWRQALIESAQEAAADLAPTLIKRIEPIYARSFTEEELAQAVAFYESPTGQTMISKMPMVMGQAMQDFGPMAQALGVDVRARFCRKIGGCDKLKSDTEAPSKS